LEIGVDKFLEFGLVSWEKKLDAQVIEVLIFDAVYRFSQLFKQISFRTSLFSLQKSFPGNLDILQLRLSIPVFLEVGEDLAEIVQYFSHSVLI